MKLLYCNRCHDIFMISHKGKCHCGESWGYYVDDLNAKYGGNCIPIGIENSSFAFVIQNQPEEGRGIEFTAFVIPKKCSTFVKVEKEDCNHEACETHQQILDEIEGEVNNLVKASEVCKRIVELRDHLVHSRSQLQLEIPGNQYVHNKVTGQIRGLDCALKILECVRKGEEYYV